MRHTEITDDQDRDNDTRRFLFWPDNQTQEVAMAEDTHTEVTFCDGCVSAAGPGNWDEITATLATEHGLRED